MIIGHLEEGDELLEEEGGEVAVEARIRGRSTEDPRRHHALEEGVDTGKSRF